MQNEVPLRTPTGCPVVPPSLPQPRSRRSFSLSQQQDSTPLLMNGPRFGMLSQQEPSFSEPRRIERTLTMPHRVPRPVQVNGSGRLPLAERASLPVGTKLSAFKQVPSQPLVLVSPQREAKLPNDRYDLEPFSLICDRAEIKLSALSSDELRIVCCQLSAPNCLVKKIE